METKEKQKGESYIEVVIALMMVLILIGPICAILVYQTKAMQTNQALNEVDAKVEMLLAELEKELVRFADYEQLEHQEIRRLEEVLRDRSLDTIEAYYQTSRYAYEVMCYPITRTKKQKRFLCYSDEQYKGQTEAYFDEVIASQDAIQTNFEKASKRKVDLKSIGQISFDAQSYDSSIHCEHQSISIRDEQISCLESQELVATIYHILSSQEYLKDEESFMIDLEIIGNQLDQPSLDYRLQVVNETNCNLVINVIGGGKTFGVANVSVIDQGLGKSLIQEGTVGHSSQSFVIAVVVRDKKPYMGQKGKIVGQAAKMCYVQGGVMHE